MTLLRKQYNEVLERGIKEGFTSFLIEGCPPKDRPIVNGYYAEHVDFLYEDGSINNNRPISLFKDAIAYRVKNQHIFGFSGRSACYNGFEDRKSPIKAYKKKGVFHQLFNKSVFVKVVEKETGTELLIRDPVMLGWEDCGRFSGVLAPSERNPNGLINISNRWEDPDKYDLEIQIQQATEELNHEH